ncbi:hypothetical protein HOP62_09970 [Halomonas sp. MCCC 1A17488]|uniref:hypothetical protein n=1 Tax=unclassified Halomonas TaxID=2609666 RepID=UPI0018D22E78|nr:MULTISPECIES: hypothetical protein [unclassified Halomonas]MCE8016394.1 hypothetical protein [Halomonas sp. MCCC 1A17488]MCG3239727.1 hypothetical protein [Halomonas sp. MCCC 1A17488]QPP50367.1 hypothetical protein I4484_04405 [Halomonas sp. SS10-MC5]
MIWHLIAAVFAGLGAAGIGLLLRTLSGKRLPRWIVPVFAGLGILGYQINHEYSWYEHKRDQLPATAQVVETEQDRMFWRPWTYAVPLTVGFSVVDHSSMERRQTDDHPLVEFILYRFEKDYVDRLEHQPYLMNCSSAELVPLINGSRQPQIDALRELDRESGLYRAVCAAE